MTLKVRVVNTEGSAAKAIAETIAKAVNAGTFAEMGVATAARPAILVASVVRALVAREAENAATFAPKAEKIARAVISVLTVAKALVANEAAVISVADRAEVVAFRVDAHHAKVDLALDREMDLVLPAKAALVQVLVLPATGIGNPVRLTTRKTTLFTVFTR